jgi:hypothetical protein
LLAERVHDDGEAQVGHDLRLGGVPGVVTV